MQMLDEPITGLLGSMLPIKHRGRAPMQDLRGRVPRDELDSTRDIRKDYISLIDTENGIDGSMKRDIGLGFYR